MTEALMTPIDILLVEDDPGDVLMTQEAFEHHKIRNSLHVVTDGVEALQFLRGEAPYAGMPRPGLILLDLNLPKKDGREVLAEIKAEPSLRSIPSSPRPRRRRTSCAATTSTRTPTSPSRWTSSASSRSSVRSTSSS